MSPAGISDFKPRLVEWFLLLPSFIVAATPFEIAEDPAAVGFATLVRTIAAVIILVVLVLRYSASLRLRATILAAIIPVYFLALNTEAFTYTAVMAATTIGAGAIITSLSENARRALAFCMGGYLVFHLFGLILAVVLLAATGTIVDLHHLIFPVSVSRAGLFIHQVRLSGFHIEPGTYANATYLVVFARALLNSKLFDRLGLIAVASTLATLSAWALIGAVAYALSALMEFIFKTPKISLMARVSAVTGALAAYAFVVPSALVTTRDQSIARYFETRFRMDPSGGSIVDKNRALEAWLHAMENWPALGHPLPQSFCDYCASPQDLGAVFNLIYYLGIPASFLIIGVAIARLTNIWGFAFLVAAAPMIVSKFFFYDFVLWMPLGCMLLVRPQTQWK